MFSYYKPIVDNDDPVAWPIWTLGACLAGFIKGVTKHCCTAPGLMVSEKKIFFYVFLLLVNGSYLLP